MRYVQLRAFHQVAISGGFSRAAEELFLTQPAISDQVRKLEQEYDVLLFNRQRKQVTLTPAGERLLAITRRFFDNERQAQELLSEARALRGGRLRLMVDSAHHVLHVIAAFRSRWPGVRIAMRAGNTETVVEELYSYEADIGVLGDIPVSRDFEVIALSATPIVAFAARGHPLLNLGRPPGFDDLMRYPLVLREQGSRTRRKLEEGARAAGVTLQPAIEAEGREAVREIVASGAGIGFVSQAEFGHDARLVPLPVAGPPMLMDEALICLAERSHGKAIAAFMGLARRFAGSG